MFRTPLSYGRVADADFEIQKYSNNEISYAKTL